MKLIGKFSKLSGPVFRAGLVYMVLAMLVAYPGLSFGTCPLEIKPQKSACQCGCGCGTANTNQSMPRGGSSGCPCGMADREVIPLAPLNATAPLMPQNLSAPVAAEIEVKPTGQTIHGLKRAQTSTPLYIRHTSLLI